MAIVDTTTGEVLLDFDALPSSKQDLPPLGDGQQVLDEMKQCYWRMELVARRLGECRKQLDGSQDPSGELRSGLSLEFEQYVEKADRDLWAQFKEGGIEKWPSEQTRRSLAMEVMAEEKPELRMLYLAVKTQVSNLEAYQRILGDQMEGLRSMFSFHKKEAELAGQQMQPGPDFSPQFQGG
jgi:hypothetical protein